MWKLMREGGIENVHTVSGICHLGDDIFFLGRLLRWERVEYGGKKLKDLVLEILVLRGL